MLLTVDITQERITVLQCIKRFIESDEPLPRKLECIGSIVEYWAEAEAATRESVA